MLFTQSSRALGSWSDGYVSESYDEAYNDSVRCLDLGRRMQNVSECQSIHYADQPYLVLAYVYENYAWSSSRYSGWGNWTEQPGRSLEGTWGANPLFFDLTPVDETKGSGLLLAVAIGAVAAVAVLVALVLLRRRSAA